MSTDNIMWIEDCKSCETPEIIKMLRKCSQSPVSLMYFLDVVETPQPERMTPLSREEEEAKRAIIREIKEYENTRFCHMIKKCLLLLERALCVMPFEDWEYGAEIFIYELKDRAAYEF